MAARNDYTAVRRAAQDLENAIAEHEWFMERPHLHGKGLDPATDKVIEAEVAFAHSIMNLPKFTEFMECYWIPSMDEARAECPDSQCKGCSNFEPYSDEWDEEHPHRFVQDPDDPYFGMTHEYKAEQIAAARQSQEEVSAS